MLVLAGLIGGVGLLLVAGTFLGQLAWLSPRAQRVADAVGAAVGGTGRRSASLTGKAVRGTGRQAASLPGRVTRALRRAPRVLGVLALRVLPFMVGSLVLLAGLDWAVGAAWDRAVGDEVPAARDGRRLAATDLPPTQDPRVASPAFATSPWADRYLAELEVLDFTYEPYLGPRDAAVHGRHINAADGVRDSYEPARLPADGVLDVWFLGGSTMWGEGQRDLHTIPSEVARLAEDRGIALRAWNFGVRGYTAFQEYLVFEREVARRGPPDLAVFYHGVNESYSLLESPENLGPQPSLYQIETYQEAFGRAPTLPGQVPAPEPAFAAEYRHTSLLGKLWRATTASLTPPAVAQGARYEPPHEDVERAQREAAQIYRRSMALIRHETDAHGVPTLVFWQPGPEWEPDPFRRNWYLELSAEVATVGGGIDLSGALFDPPAPIYIDGVHTNELGARLVAEAMWPHLEPALRGAASP